MTYRFTLTLLAILALPGIAHAQADPGPPPASAAAVPTLAEAKSFIEENIVAASLLKCPYDPGKSIEGGGRAEINGNKLLLSSAGTEVLKSRDGTSTLGTREMSTVSSFNVTDVDAHIHRRNDGCQGARLDFSCKPGSASCIVRKYTSNQKWYDTDGKIEDMPSGNSGTSPATGLEIGDVALAVRIIKAFRFYQSEIAKITPRSAF